MATAIETGEIHFFYRPKMDVSRVSGVKDVQRLFIGLVPDGAERARLLLVGRKRLPDIISGEAGAAERDWMMVVAAGAVESVASALHPMRYDTKTRGERETAAAAPVGSGRYAIFMTEGDSRLVFKLARPKRVGEAQQAFEIPEAANYVLSVKNPEIETPGFPDEKPDYPDELAKAFADERWIAAEDTRLLDHENAQLLLIGAREDGAPEEIDLSGEADPFETFGLDADAWPTDSLDKGRFADPTRAPDAVDAEGDRTKGGERGGRAAARTDSAAGVAAALKGVDFPASRADLRRCARDNDAPGKVVDLIEALPDERYAAMDDVARAVGDVR